MVKKKAKKKQKTSTLYYPLMAKQVRAIIEILPLNRTNDLPFGKIAKYLGVTPRTIRNWRKKGSKSYQRDFAIAVERAKKRKFKALGIENR